MLRDPISYIRRDQRERDLDLRIAGAMAKPQTGPAHRNPEQHLERNDGRELACRLWQREYAGRNRRDREAIDDQRGRVVGEALTLEHDKDPARQSKFAGDREWRDYVRRRDDGAEQETDAPRQSDQIMHGGGD